MSLIFISHSIADKPVVDDLFDLLQMGCNLKREDIFCSSVEGAGIETGKDFVEWIYGKLYDSKFVILFVTPNYFASRFCVAEMGAAWALKKDVFPLVIPEMPRGAGAVLIGKQTAVVEPSGLDELRDKIAKHYKPAAKATARWSLKKDEFHKKFMKKVSELPKPSLVDEKLLEEEKEKTTAAMEMYEEVTEELEQLQEKIALLEKAKDAEEVKEIKAKFMPEKERYGELVKKANKALSKLDYIEVRCVYASVIDEAWSPTRYTWNEERSTFEKAMQSKWIYDNGDGLKANDNHPKMKPIFSAIYELDSFISQDLSGETREAMEEEYGYYIDIDNREYWEEALYEFHMAE